MDLDTMLDIMNYTFLTFVRISYGFELPQMVSK